MFEISFNKNMKKKNDNKENYNISFHTNVKKLKIIAEHDNHYNFSNIIKH